MEAPMWFVVLGAVVLVLYIIGRIVHIPSEEFISVITGGQGGCGCLIKSIIGVLCCILLIWFIISELF